MPQWLRDTVILVLVSVWAINFTLPIFKPGFVPSPELNVALMAVLGVMLGGRAKDAER